MPGIFISYRREDAGGYARGIADCLKQELDVPFFMDIDAIDPGAYFVEAIEKAVGACDVLIALIGTRWLDAADEDGQRRLDDAKDFIRLEIGSATGSGRFEKAERAFSLRLRYRQGQV